MLIHGSELVAVAQGLVEYWDSRWIFSALRYDLKNPSTSSAAPSCGAHDRCGPFVGVAKARAASGLQKSGSHSPTLPRTALACSLSYGLRSVGVRVSVTRYLFAGLGSWVTFTAVQRQRERRGSLPCVVSCSCSVHYSCVSCRASLQSWGGTACNFLIRSKP